MEKLRLGNLNLIIATSMVEEGVDIQSCSFVVAFDGLSSVKGYIQMKGRARRSDARFFVFRDSLVEKKSHVDLTVAMDGEMPPLFRSLDGSGA